jgi:hypothetical protein
VTRKIDAFTPWWKRPVWWWTRRFGEWPVTAEFLSAAFDYNVAPFFQSFVEVKVQPSANQVRVILSGVHGRLKWAGLPRQMPSGGWFSDGYVEWIHDPNRSAALTLTATPHLCPIGFTGGG